MTHKRTSQRSFVGVKGHTTRVRTRNGIIGNLEHFLKPIISLFIRDLKHD